VGGVEPGLWLRSQKIESSPMTDTQPQKTPKEMTLEDPLAPLPTNSETFTEWSDKVAEAIVEGLNAAVLAEIQKDELEKNKAR